MDLVERLFQGLADTLLGTRQVVYQGETYDFGSTFRRVTVEDLVVHFNPGLDRARLRDVEYLRGVCATLGIQPTHLMVPNGLEQLALDITGSVRPVGVGTAGGQSTSASIAGVQMPNWLAGNLDVIVNPCMTSGTYSVMALGNPDVRPIYYGIARPFEAHVVDDPQSEPMKERSSYAYYAEGYMA